MQKATIGSSNPNRNVIDRRAPAKPRVESRTTEFDCSGIAELLEAQEAKQAKAAAAARDLDAEIEIVSALPATTPRGVEQRAHTLRRADATPAPSPVPPPTAVASELPAHAPGDPVASVASVASVAPVGPSTPVEPAVTVAMPAVSADLAIEAELAEPAPRASRWWLVAGAAMLVASAVAVLAAL